MSKPSEHKRRKHDKRRAEAKQRAKERELPRSPGELIRLAATKPFGPAWICAGYADAAGAEGDGHPPALVTVVVTRTLRGELLLPCVALVDRTCLGVKDGWVMEPAGEHLISARMVEWGDELGEPLVRCEPLLAQSIVLHALDYASRLGFRPHDGFAAALFEPRPTELLATRWARPARPIYCAGPNDDTRRILRTLDAAVGRGNYEFVGLLDDDGDDDDGDDDDDDSERWGGRDDPWRDDDDPWDEAACQAAIERLRARRARAPSPPIEGAIDWQLACDGVPSEHILDGTGIDLDPRAPPPSDLTLHEAVEHFVWLLEQRKLLAWEAVLRDEQGLVLTQAQAHELGQLVSFSEDDDVTLWLGDDPRPTEPWYDTLRALAPLLVVPRFVSRTMYYDGATTRGAELLRAVQAHARELSLPPGCTRPIDVLPRELWHRLELQSTLAALAGLGARDREGGISSLADDGVAGRIDEFFAALDAHAKTMAALGWSLADLLALIELPADDRERLLAAERTRARRRKTDLGQISCEPGG